MTANTCNRIEYGADRNTQEGSVGEGSKTVLRNLKNELMNRLDRGEQQKHPAGRHKPTAARLVPRDMHPSPKEQYRTVAYTMLYCYAGILLYCGFTDTGDGRTMLSEGI